MNFKDRYNYDSTKDLLGTGGFAKVFLATDVLLDRKVALKFFPVGQKDRYTVIAEIRRVISLEHANIARYYDAIVLESPNVHGEIDKVEVGIMEYLDGGDLKTYFIHKATTQELRKKLLLDVLHGLSYLHEHGIIHRDLKPENILIKETAKGPIAKITDFGISKETESSQKSSSAILGSIEYMAPEQFNPARYGVNGKITHQVDLWSYGLMVYELFSSSQLFGSRSTGDTSEQVMNNILQSEMTDRIHSLEEPWRSVVRMCVVKNASERVQNAASLISLLEQSEKKIHSQNSQSGVFDSKRDQPQNVVEEKKIFEGIYTQVIPEQRKTASTPTEPNELHSKTQETVSDAVSNKVEPTATETAISRKGTGRLYVKLFIGTILILIIVTIAYLSLKSEKNSIVDSLHTNMSVADSLLADGNLDSALAIYAQMDSTQLTADQREMIQSLQTIGTDDDEGSIWGTTQDINSIQAYRFYLAKFPDGIYQTTAKSRIDSLINTVVVSKVNEVSPGQPESNDEDPGELAERGKALYDQKKYAEAVPLLQSAAEKGDAVGQGYYAACLMYGRGVTQNYDAAKIWAGKSAASGNEMGLFVLGRIYDSGLGTAVNYDLAFQYYTQSAEKGNSSAMNNLGSLYHDGHGTEKNPSLGGYWYLKSAEAGNASGQLNVGLGCFNAEGFVKDYNEASLWFMKSADQGNITAQYYVALCYDKGYGFAIDWVQAADWYEKAAGGGNMTAKRELGTFYLFGVGGKIKDKNKARSLFNECSNAGDTKAKTYIQIIDQLGVQKEYSGTNSFGDKITVTNGIEDAHVMAKSTWQEQVTFTFGRSNSVRVYPTSVFGLSAPSGADEIFWTEITSTVEHQTDGSDHIQIKSSVARRSIGYMYVNALFSKSIVEIKSPMALCWLPK